MAARAAMAMVVGREPIRSRRHSRRLGDVGGRSRLFIKKLKHGFTPRPFASTGQRFYVEKGRSNRL